MDLKGLEKTGIGLRSARFQHTTNSEQKEASGNGLKALENGGRGWIFTSDPCRVKAEHSSPTVLKLLK